MKKLIDTKADMVLVDSRPKRSMYDKGHIPTAISIPDSEFDKLKDQLPQDKEKQLIFYCEGFKCKLSHNSAAKAIGLGYKNVAVYAAGYPAWKTLDADSAEEAKKMAASIKPGKEEGSIDVAVFETIIEEKPESIILIDVRDPDEFKAGSFETAINVPTDKLEEKIKTLSEEKPVVFICSTGARSGEAYYMVKDLRPKFKDVYYLEAELTFNKDGSHKITKK
ncbi:MAG: rhodanese-like domain-containing protein [Desulfobacterales bacterium]|nr:rhodanese-like domain-containing protein [Desulfobacterales bacterium]